MQQVQESNQKTPSQAATPVQKTSSIREIPVQQQTPKQSTSSTSSQQSTTAKNQQNTTSAEAQQSQAASSNRTQSTSSNASQKQQQPPSKTQSTTSAASPQQQQQQQQPKQTLSSASLAGSKSETVFIPANVKVPEGYYAAPAQFIGQLSSSKPLNPNDLSSLDTSFLNKLVRDHKNELKFPDTHLDEINYQTFVDPFSADLFRDEIIDIDYGAIDAFTNALNSQLDINQRGPQTDLRADSHVVKGNYPAFIDNQYLLGDYANSYAFTSFDEFNDDYAKRKFSVSNIIDVKQRLNSNYNNGQKPATTTSSQSLVIENVPFDISGQLSLDELNRVLQHVASNNGEFRPQQLINELREAVRVKNYH